MYRNRGISHFYCTEAEEKKDDIEGDPEKARDRQGRRDPYNQLWHLVRITESQDRIGWKRPLRSSSPTLNLTLPSPPLHHVPEHLIQTSVKYLQGWRLHHFPGQPVPMLDNPFSEVKFPNIQSKPPLVQPEAISSRPITCDLGEETDPTSLHPPAAVESDEVSPQPPFLQAEQPQVPQPLPISLVLQTLPQLHCPSLDTLQPLKVSLGVGGPKLNTAFEVRPHQCRVQGTITALVLLATLFLIQARMLLAFLATWAHCQLVFTRLSTNTPRSFSARQLPSHSSPSLVAGVVVTQVQDPALGLVEPHTIDLSPWIQPLQVPLQSLPALQQINTPAQLGVICKLTENKQLF
ncbi:LOW QUALITY PROTEIN: hypothetical protein QYF61_016820, partial [Mycteria americana]